MDRIRLDGYAEQQQFGDVDRGCQVLRGLPAGASGPIRAIRRLRIVDRVWTPLVPVVLGLVVAALALVFSLTGDTFAIFLLVPSALAGIVDVAHRCEEPAALGLTTRVLMMKARSPDRGFELP